MQLRDHGAIVSKRDYFLVDPLKIVVDPAYNVRHLDAPEAQAKLAELQLDITENGVKVPVEVRLDEKDRVVLVAGHRRLRATLAAIKAGAEILSIPAMAEAKHTSEADRVLALHTSNSGEPLTSLERAEIVRRLVGYGWDRPTIARRMGYQTVAPIDALLELHGAPEEVKAMVRNGEVSATVAARAVRKDRASAWATLKAAKAAGGKKKATAKGLAKAAGKTHLTESQITTLIHYLQRIAKRSSEEAWWAQKALETVGL